MRRIIAMVLITALLFTNLFQNNYSVYAKNSNNLIKEKNGKTNSNIKKNKKTENKEKNQIIIKYRDDNEDFNYIEDTSLEDNLDIKSEKEQMKLEKSNKKEQEKEEKKAKKKAEKEENKAEKQQKKDEKKKQKQQKKLEKQLRKQEKKVSKKDKDKVKNSVKQNLDLKKFETKQIFNNTNLELIEISENDDIEDVIEALLEDEMVEFVQPNYKLYSESIEKDERYDEQWGLNNVGQIINGIEGVQGNDLNIQNVWQEYGYGKNILIGVLDSEIDINHNDLKNSIYVNTEEIDGNGIDDDGNGYIDDVNGWDFYNRDRSVFDTGNDTHGTHIAGIIAAEVNNTGVQGIAPNSQIVPLKFLENGEGYTSDAIDAIEYAENLGVSIMNCSFGSPYYNMILEDAMRYTDIMFVCSAGNNHSTELMYPAAFSLENVISVGSSNNRGEISDFSNQGDFVDIYAPGEDILSTIPDQK